MALAPKTASTASGDEAAARLERLITAECRRQIRETIAEYDGAEVFFIGRLDAELAIEEVEPLAFGNRRAVPAILQYASPGDVVLHNHPSGQLEPSDADVDISSEMGGRGIGSYIIDNECTEIRIVVRPFRQAGCRPIDVDKITNELRPGGAIAERLEGYEDRPEQIAMLNAVAEAFNRDAVAVIEAGTGTGKSLAYLLPAIAWAIRNNEKVVVSTHTINLQEQLLEKDLPLLLRASGLQFEAALLKGRNNYLCRRKAHYLKSHPEFLDAGEKDAQLAQIQGWIKTTTNGSRSDLAFAPEDEVWEKVMSEADNCLRVRCPFYNKCFFYNARRSAARAQVLIVNHHLLMADLALRAESENYSQSAVLPPFHRLIVDEAHHLEEVATGYFGARAGRGALQYAMRRLMKPKTGDGLLRYLANKIHSNVYTTLAPAEHDELLMKLAREAPLQHQELLTAMEEAVDLVAEAMERTTDVPLEKPVELKRRIKAQDLDSPFWRETVEPPLRSVLTAARPYLENLRRVGRTLRPFLEDGNPERATPILELHSTINKIESILQRLMRFLGGGEGHCRWIEYRRRPGGRKPDAVFCIAPLEMATQLREQLLRRFRTVVLTSATLTVERRFDYFLNQIGADDPSRLGLLGAAASQPRTTELDEDRPAETAAEPPASEQARPRAAAAKAEAPLDEPCAERLLRTLLLDTPFNYERQVYIGVPTDLPEPTEAAFEGALAEFLGPALEISRGRAFVLFTAYSLLERLFERLAPRLEGLGYPCLRQGQSGRTMLTEAFRREIGSVLFATSSFWEGVDVQGEALSCLVLTRLPFRVPGEPLIEARIEALRAEGKDPFHELIVPQAVIRFRQGFGRLIRSRTDRGAVLICDRRLITRPYGRMFLHSLPSDDVHCSPARDVLDRLSDFFE